MVAVPEGQLENQKFTSLLKLADLKGSAYGQMFLLHGKSAGRVSGFQACLLKLLPDVTILIGMLSEAGSPKNFGLP